MSRRTKLLIAAGVVFFLGVSLLLARYLSTENNERDAVYGLLRDQARGDVPGMLRRLDGCDASCRAAVVSNARRLKRPGDASGPTRVAWTIVNRQLPVVQCVEVQRTGSVLTGRAINLRRLSVPINSTGSC